MMSDRRPVQKLATGIPSFDMIAEGGLPESSVHDKDIREFTIDADGMHLGRPFRHVTGILAGTPRHILLGDVERVWTHFDAEISSREGAL